MAANLPGGGMDLPDGAEGARYGVCYDQAGCQELFQKVAGSLAETLSSSGAPETVSRAEWETALTGRLGVYIDFQGQIPLSVLVGWLSGGETGLTATVRRLVLTQWEGGPTFITWTRETAATTAAAPRWPTPSPWRKPCPG